MTDDVAGVLLSAAELLRQCSTYNDILIKQARQRTRDETRTRQYREDQRAVVFQMEQHHDAIQRTAQQLEELDPATVHAAPATLDYVRSLAKHLTYELDHLAVAPSARRAFPWQPAPGPRLDYVPYRVVAYLRVSTDRQADDGLGLDVQEAAIREWASRNRARIAFVVRDEGRSGTADVIDRPGLAEALGHIQAGRAEAVVVARVDRLARDLVLQEWLRAEVLRSGGELRSASPVEDVYMRDDPDDPTGNLVRQILGAVAEYERAMVRLRMEAGKAMKRKAGGYAGGQPPYGFRAVDRDLVANLDEQRTVQRMRRWRREGKSLRDIAERLNSDGVPARRGRWHPQTVARVVDRAS